MQIAKKDYNPELHEVYKALTVRQPWADLMTRAVGRMEDGEYFAEKMIEVRSRITRYRGELLICSSAKPSDLPGHLAGCTCGLVEVYGVKRVEDFGPEDWAATCIPEGERPRTGWGWLLRNPRRVVEMPIRGQLGLYDLIVPKGDITEYPRAMAFGADGWKMVQNKVER